MQEAHATFSLVPLFEFFASFLPYNSCKLVNNLIKMVFLLYNKEYRTQTNLGQQHSFMRTFLMSGLMKTNKTVMQVESNIYFTG